MSTHTHTARALQRLHTRGSWYIYASMKALTFSSQEQYSGTGKDSFDVNNGFE